jgi:hypothetical protein
MLSIIADFIYRNLYIFCLSYQFGDIQHDNPPVQLQTVTPRAVYETSPFRRENTRLKTAVSVLICSVSHWHLSDVFTFHNSLKLIKIYPYERVLLEQLVIL